MQTAPANASLPELLQQVQLEPVFIVDGDHDVAVLLSREDFDRNQLMKVEAFERSRDAMIMEMGRKMHQDGVRMEQFVQDLLK